MPKRKALAITEPDVKLNSLVVRLTAFGLKLSQVPAQRAELSQLVGELALAVSAATVTQATENNQVDRLRNEVTHLYNRIYQLQNENAALKRSCGMLPELASFSQAAPGTDPSVGHVVTSPPPGLLGGEEPAVIHTATEGKINPERVALIGREEPEDRKENKPQPSLLPLQKTGSNTLPLGSKQRGVTDPGFSFAALPTAATPPPGAGPNAVPLGFTQSNGEGAPSGFGALGAITSFPLQTDAQPLAFGFSPSYMASSRKDSQNSALSGPLIRDYRHHGGRNRSDQGGDHWSPALLGNAGVKKSRSERRHEPAMEKRATQQTTSTLFSYANSGTTYSDGISTTRNSYRNGNTTPNSSVADRSPTRDEVLPIKVVDNLEPGELVQGFTESKAPAEKQDALRGESADGRMIKTSVFETSSTSNAAPAPAQCPQQ